MMIELSINQLKDRTVGSQTQGNTFHTDRYKFNCVNWYLLVGMLVPQASIASDPGAAILYNVFSWSLFFGLLLVVAGSVQNYVAAKRENKAALFFVVRYFVKTLLLVLIVVLMLLLSVIAFIKING